MITQQSCNPLEGVMNILWGALHEPASICLQKLLQQQATLDLASFSVRIYRRTRIRMPYSRAPSGLHGCEAVILILILPSDGF